eukprot:m.73347 g.73347  ORF g.73347 m.73347 type:complete len:55 (-) comp13889_c0_seq2:546-710(-)
MRPLAFMSAFLLSFLSSTGILPSFSPSSFIPLTMMHGRGSYKQAEQEEHMVAYK